MKVRDFSFSPDALDRNGISVAQQLAGADNLTITGAYATGGVATLDIPRQVAIYCAGDISGVTFTVTGTDRRGDALTEDITGVNATTVSGTYDFKTVTQVAADGAVGTDVEVGTYSSFNTGWFPVDYRGWTTEQRLYLSDSPSMTCDVYKTLANPFAAAFDEYTCDSELVQSVSASASISITTGLRALRLKVSSFTAGDLTWSIWQR